MTDLNHTVLKKTERDRPAFTMIGDPAAAACEGSLCAVEPSAAACADSTAGSDDAHK